MKNARAVLILVLTTGLGAYKVGGTHAQPADTNVVVGEAPAADADWLPAPEVLAVRTAEHYMGAPYEWGGETPEGFDCSGFAQHVYALNGIDLPRISVEQAGVGDPVTPALDQLRPGDLLFFATAGPEIDHVAIYAGDARIIHSSIARGGVGTDRMDRGSGRWYARKLVAARRVIGSTLEPGRSE